MPVQTANNRKSQADSILLAVDAEECRRSLKRFKRSVWHIIEPAPYVDGWCQDALDEHLEAVARGDIRKLVINIPPRHTKSTELVIWRAWLWTQEPEAQILAASYALSLSIRDNLKVRRILEDPWFTERYGNLQITDARVELSDDNNQKMMFENTRGGFQKAVSVGGGTTGHGGKFLIIDDLHNATEAHRDTDRENAVTWFREVWTNRANDQETARFVTVGQRIHEEDVCGYILKERPDWEHLNLPAEYEPTRKCYTSIGWRDPRTQEGDLLWSERFSAATLDGLKRDLGSTGYAAQYQQSPVPAGGGMFKQSWFRYFNETSEAFILHGTTGAKSVLKSHCRTFGTLDLAISSKQNADYTVFCVWSVTPDHDLLLRHVARAHLDNAAQLRQLQSLHSRFRPDYWKVETVAYQLAFFQQAIQQGLPCREFRPVRDKVSRAATASVWSENGKTYFLANAGWLADWESEHLSFPKGAHDDQVDNHSMAAEDVVTPTGPVMWSPDTMVDPSVMTQKQEVAQPKHNMVQVDWGKGGKDGLDDLSWNFDEGDMHDFETGGRW